LAEAAKEVFALQTQKKESQHKIDRLHDYERQIEQHLKVQRLWQVFFFFQQSQLTSMNQGFGLYQVHSSGRGNGAHESAIQANGNPPPVLPGIADGT
jgi:hypothetical protein